MLLKILIHIISGMRYTVHVLQWMNDFEVIYISFSTSVLLTQNKKTHKFIQWLWDFQSLGGLISLDGDTSGISPPESIDCPTVKLLISSETGFIVP